MLVQPRNHNGLGPLTTLKGTQNVAKILIATIIPLTNLHKCNEPKEKKYSKGSAGGSTDSRIIGI